MAKKAGKKLLTLAQIRKKFPGSKKGSEIYLDIDSSLWLPSRILALNYQTGGGIPYGKILDGHGQESAGKSALAYDFSYCCQACGGQVIWADPEGSFDPHWAQKQGVDPDKVELLEDEITIERISDWMGYQMIYWRSKLVNNEPILAVIDSFAVMESMDLEGIDLSDRKAVMGKRAQKIGEMLRYLAPIAKKYGIILYPINQLRKKVGASQFEDPDTVPGGEAAKFYASIRLGLYRGKKLTDKEGNIYGGVSFVRVKKNKVAPPRKSIKVEIYSEPHLNMVGYNKYLGFLGILLEKGIVKKKRMVGITYKGKKIAPYQNENEEPFIKALMANDSLRKKLIKKSGINTVNILKERLASVKKNLYPVKIKAESDAE